MKGDLLPATFGGTVVEGMAEALMLRRSRQRAQEENDSAWAWRDYAQQLQNRCDFLEREVARLQLEAKKLAATAEAVREVEAAVAHEGATCFNHEHHKLSGSPEKRMEMYQVQRKLSSEKRGLVYTPVTKPKVG